MTNFISHIKNYQLARLKPGKFPKLDSMRNKNREYLVSLTVYQTRPDLTHLFFCCVMELNLNNLDLLN